MALAGIVVIGFTLKEAVDSYRTLGIIDLLVSFFIPIVFSALFVPIAYVFTICAKYEMLFIRMSFKEPKDTKLNRYHRKVVFISCGLSYKKIAIFQKEYLKNMYISMKQNEFDDLLKRFRAEQTRIK